MQELSTTSFDAVIVGGGLAGLTAACYLARGGCSVLLLEKADQLGDEPSQPSEQVSSLTEAFMPSI